MSNLINFMTPLNLYSRFKNKNLYPNLVIILEKNIIIFKSFSVCLWPKKNHIIKIHLISIKTCLLHFTWIKIFDCYAHISWWCKRKKFKTVIFLFLIFFSSFQHFMKRMLSCFLNLTFPFYYTIFYED